MLVPVIYYGIQPLLAPFYPGYDFRTDVVSLLGSDRSPVAIWFNLAVILSGLFAIVGTVGLWRALAGQPPKWLRLLLVLALAGVGLGNIWAGIFALPDPRHGANPFAPAFFVVPALLCLASWLAPPLRGLRWYMTANLALFGLFAIVMAGLTGLDRGANAGWLQRVGAFTIMGAIGIIGLHLFRREARSPGQRPPRTSQP